MREREVLNADQSRSADGGYSETRLESAWRNATNQEIAASIVGHIRRAALGEALVPFEQRVRDAMQRDGAAGARTGARHRHVAATCLKNPVFSTRPRDMSMAST
ncbi:MAG: type I restriction-modification enzyme R subunit C-terminal domain-containing protein [Halomonas sp.]|uniref:type I restriction-modification enzyme R subunit C-terminal domain-containing protein n=1 Tax=Halomonas sp. TaxID=1486246 RepID=UPI002ACDF96D|nr:type I restriction-modification enzyme R subunit C-terminal domain-containing protein [Halomonas sp.]MDZ7852085.1 type I restriction-modification enzyme R subunit C-terminal domain-containing protein [Halomonas sp.]